MYSRMLHLSLCPFSPPVGTFLTCWGRVDYFIVCWGLFWWLFAFVGDWKVCCSSRNFYWMLQAPPEGVFVSSQVLLLTYLSLCLSFSLGSLLTSLPLYGPTHLSPQPSPVILLHSISCPSTSLHPVPLHPPLQQHPFLCFVHSPTSSLHPPSQLTHVHLYLLPHRGTSTWRILHSPQLRTMATKAATSFTISHRRVPRLMRGP